MKAVLSTDGGARGNPGPAAIGIVLDIEGAPVIRISESIGDATNNVAEYRAILRGLEEARRAGVTHLECRLDSELVVRQLQQEYRVKDPTLAQLFVRVWNIAQGFRSVRFVTIPRSANRAADRLVNDALTSAGHPKQPPPFRRPSAAA